MLEKMKNSWKKFLETIAKQNKKTFGDDKMDCCDLNKDKKDTKKK